MLVLVGSDREPGERRSELGVSDRRTRSMVFSGTGKDRTTGKGQKEEALCKITAYFSPFSTPVTPNPQKPQRTKYQAKDQMK